MTNYWGSDPKTFTIQYFTRGIRKYIALGMAGKNLVFVFIKYFNYRNGTFKD